MPDSSASTAPSLLGGSVGGATDGVRDSDDLNQPRHSYSALQSGAVLTTAPRSQHSAFIDSAFDSSTTTFDINQLGSSSLTLQEEINNIMASAVNLDYMPTTHKNDDEFSALALGVKAGAEDALKGFNEDPLTAPFDLAAPIFDLGNPITFPVTSLSYDTTVQQQNPLVQDHELDSPLGLEQDSPFSELLASPAFGLLASPSALVGLTGGEPDFHALFPPPPHSYATAPLPIHHLPSFPPLPPLLPSANPDLSPFLSNSSTPALSPQQQSPPATIDTTSATRPRATGFRGASTPLLGLDAPIRPREYKVPSATAKKRKTTAIERGLAKRGRSSSQEAEKREEEIPEDLLDAAERKRLQNTLSARKSRQRKQNRLAELEQKSSELEQENEGLKRRVLELETIMRSIGAAV